MEVEEKYKVTVRGKEVADRQLAELLIKHSQKTTEGVKNKIQRAIENLKNEFLKQGYSEDELVAEVSTRIDAHIDSYGLDIHVYVYPRIHQDVYKHELILSSYFIKYTDEGYTKELNELGTNIKNRMTILIKMTELEEENEKLKQKIKYLETELEKYREKCGEQIDEDP